MNNDDVQESNNSDFRGDLPNDEFRGGNAYATFNDPDPDLNDSIPDNLETGQPHEGPQVDGTNVGHADETIGGTNGTTIPTNPVTVNVQRHNVFGQIRPVILAPPINPQVVQQQQPIARPTSPLIQIMNNDGVDELVNQLGAVNLNAVPAPGTSQTPDYLPPNEQIKKINKIELEDSQNQALQSSLLVKLLNVLTSENNAEDLRLLKQELNLEADKAKDKAKIKQTTQDTANRIVQYYKSPITKPVIRIAPDDYKKSFHRTSPREITGVTGTFDPKNPHTDFSHMWSKLIGYGQSNYFTEEEYKDALRYILLGDAYETFLSFEQTNQTFDYIIEYFGKVYTPKRTLNVHRQAVDNFVRFKDETLDIAMHRCLVAIDKLRILYNPEAWTETRLWLRRNILTQIITEDTRRYIRLEEDDILEKFGIPIELETLISMANKYEIQHNKAPKSELKTMFQVASGGLTEDPQKLRNELSHLKKETFLEKNLKNNLMEIMANPVMTKRFSSDKDRESRRSSTEDNRHAIRQNRFDRNRSIEPELRSPSPAPPTPSPRAPDVKMEHSGVSQSPRRESQRYDRPTPRATPSSERFGQMPYHSVRRDYSRERPVTPSSEKYAKPPIPSYRPRETSYDARNYSNYNKENVNPRNQQQRSDSRQRSASPYPRNQLARPTYQRSDSRNDDRRPNSYQNQDGRRPFNRNVSFDRNSRNNNYRDSSYNRGSTSYRYEDRNKPRERSYSRDRYQGNDRDRRQEPRREQDDRYSRDRGRSPNRGSSSYTVDRRPDSRNRMSSLTRYENIPDATKFITVNLNGLGHVAPQPNQGN